jgi:hypothetical protein
MSLPRLPAHRRRRVRYQFVGRDQVRRDHGRRAAVASPQGRQRRAGRSVLLRQCGTYVWSQYGGRPETTFARAGTLAKPDAVAPDVHIYTRSKLPWLELPAGVPAFRSFYEIEKVWSPASLERLRALRAETAAAKS